MGMATQEHKQRAAELGLDWETVRAFYDEARGLEREEVERQSAFRRDAVRAQSGDVHGGRFKLAHRAAFNGGDATYIRGLDVTAADRGFDADTLFAELATAAPAMGSADDAWAAAIDRAAALAAAPEREPEYIGLVHAAALADITEQWLRQLVKAGKVRGRKAGRNWLVCREDVEFFARHPTAGRPRFRHAQDPAPF